MSKKIFALVCTYRKDRTIDKAIDEILKGPISQGAEVNKVYLLDKKIEFCHNCRSCTQKEGMVRGKCVLSDDMDRVLTDMERADVIVFAAPVNYYNVNALTRRFIERLICYTYWPWGSRGGPLPRLRVLEKDAYIVVSSAAPGFLIPFMTGATRVLKIAAGSFGARVAGTLYLGLAAQSENQPLSNGQIRSARNLGKKIMSHKSGME
ncbi:MAG: flavodoxin family protein [Oligoflexales bacterium]|nr:flavodoxin family protein [Oligoflexales bacterium]